MPDRNLFRLKAERLLKDENCFVIDVVSASFLQLLSFLCISIYSCLSLVLPSSPLLLVHQFNGKHVKISLVDDELCQYDPEKLTLAAEQRLANESSSNSGFGGGGAAFTSANGSGGGGASGAGAGASSSQCGSSSAAARKRQRRGAAKPRPTIAAVVSNPDKLLSFTDCDQWCKYVERYLSPDASMPADLRARVNTRNKVFLPRLV